MIELRRILIPTDFSKYSHAALIYAVALAERFDSELCLLHVVQNLALVIPDVITMEPSALPSPEQFTPAILAGFERLIDENHLDKQKTRREIREGTPFYEIIQFARENNSDLIVMGTHGHSGLAHVLLGSVTEKVVRKAPCPVLTVRHPEHEFVHP